MVMEVMIVQALVVRDGVEIRQPLSYGEFLQERPNIIHLLVSWKRFQHHRVLWYWGVMVVCIDHSRGMDIVQGS